VSVKRAVIDTNVLVSAGINPAGKPAQVLAAVEQLILQPIVSVEVMAEYGEVLARPHFRFQAEWIERLLGNFEALGMLLDPAPIDATLSYPPPRCMYKSNRFMNARRCGASSPSKRKSTCKRGRVTCAMTRGAPMRQASWSPPAPIRTWAPEPSRNHACSPIAAGNHISHSLSVQPISRSKRSA
jgi:hypothetical protein